MESSGLVSGIRSADPLPWLVVVAGEQGAAGGPVGAGPSGAARHATGGGGLPGEHRQRRLHRQLHLQHAAPGAGRQGRPRIPEDARPGQVTPPRPPQVPLLKNGSHNRLSLGASSTTGLSALAFEMFRGRNNIGHLFRANCWWGTMNRKRAFIAV